MKSFFNFSLIFFIALQSLGLQLGRSSDFSTSDFIKYQSFFIEELEENLSEKNLETTETLDTKQNYSLSLAFLIKPVASVLIMSIYHYASSRVLASTASGLSPPL